jgi:hypothetical protein
MAADLRDGVESLTQSLEHLRHELVIQNQIPKESLEVSRDLKKITHLMFVFFFFFFLNLLSWSKAGWLLVD